MGEGGEGVERSYPMKGALVKELERRTRSGEQETGA
jgi:hypothetical protein